MKLTQLKPTDVFLLLKLVASIERMSQAQLAESLGISVSTVNESLQRARVCHLYDRTRGVVLINPLRDFLEHGIRYAFPSSRGPMVRGDARRFSN
jgi:DNA-binding Lrp family transcriptional regulator